MAPKTRKTADVSEAFADGRKIDEAVRAGARQAVLQHKRKKAPRRP